MGSGMGERLAWFRDYLPAVSDNMDSITPDSILQLVEGYLSRFDDEIEQINLKNSIGARKKQKGRLHKPRQDSIELTKKIEAEEFEGCGLEMVDWFDAENLEYFKSWDGPSSTSKTSSSKSS